MVWKNDPLELARHFPNEATVFRSVDKMWHNVQDKANADKRMSRLALQEDGIAQVSIFFYKKST